MRSIFERVLNDLGVAPSTTLFVGDEYYADMVGAKSIGLSTIWINNRKVSIDDQIAKYGADTAPDFVLNSITEFAELF